MAVTLVTGASRGIGAAVAFDLARAGHDVGVNFHRHPDQAAEVVETIEGLGRKAVAIGADVTDEAAVERMFAECAEALGQVTGLVNNAGATMLIAPLVDTPAQTVRRVIDLNLTATVLCARQAAQLMATSRGGSGGVIVNISSAGSAYGSPGEYVHYAAAKAGVDTFTMGLAKELAGDGIRVNAVSPGLVHSGIHADAGVPDRATASATRVPLGRDLAGGGLAVQRRGGLRQRSRDPSVRRALSGFGAG
jgi:NAD(P)-dependent dehydrogenase (short-subunit alcohol dehydrogenase family)